MSAPRPSKKELLILEMLIRNGEMYGLEMVKASSGLKRGTIYVTLGRMADKGWVQSRQVKEAGVSGLPRRLFQTTELGSRVYDAWQTYLGAVAAGQV